MVLTAIIPLIGVELTKRLTGKIMSSGAGVAKEVALKKSRTVVNTLSRRLLKKEIFKKRVSELDPDDLKLLLEDVFTSLGTEFSKVTGDLLQDISEANDVIVETVRSLEDQLAKVDDFGNYIIRSLKKELREGVMSREDFKDLFEESVGDWFFDLEESIEKMNEQQVDLLKQTLTMELAVFQQNFAVISGQISHLTDLIEEGVKMDEEQYNQLLAIFHRRFREREISFDELLRMSAAHTGWMMSNRMFKSERDIPFDPEIYLDRGYTPLFEKFLHADSKLFLLLGDAGMGKTWLLTSTALRWVEQGYPAFYISLRNGLNNSFRLIFGNELVDFEYFMTALDPTLTKPMILALDGFDEMRSGSEKGELINYLLGLLQKTTMLKIVLTSRPSSWYQDRYTQQGRHPNVLSTLYRHEHEDHSITLDLFSDSELERLFPLYQAHYSSDTHEVPEIKKWPQEIRELAASPIWLRFICQMYVRGIKPSIDSLQLFDFYFERMGADDEHLNAIGLMAELLLKNNKHMGSALSSLALTSVPVEDLLSMNIIRRVDKRLLKFQHPIFGLYGVARKICSDLLFLQMNSGNEEDVENLRKLVSAVYEEYRPTVLSLIEQMMIANGIIVDKGLLDRLQLPVRTLETIDITDQVVEGLRKITEANQSLCVPLADLEVLTSIPLTLLKRAIIEMLSTHRIRGKLDNKGTMDITDDDLILQEDWDESHRQLLRMDELSRNVEDMSPEELRRAKEEISSLNHLPEQSRIELTQHIEELLHHYPRMTVVGEQADEQQDIVPEEQQFYPPMLEETREPVESPADEILQIIEALESELERAERGRYSEDLFETFDNLIEQVRELKPLVSPTIQERLSSFEEKVQYSRSMFQLADYHGAEMIKRDADVLAALEEEVGEIPKKENLRWSSFGYVLKDKMVVSVALADKHLKNLPDIFSQLMSLQNLWMEGNDLTSFPLVLCRLSNLEILDLSHNRISYVPSDIEDMKNLEALYLYKNKLTALPKGVGGLVNLRTLDLQKNKIYHIPDEIGGLVNLEELHLQENRLTSIPPGIGGLTSLKKLMLNGNQLRSLPESIGNLSSLEYLNLKGNMLTTLPDEITLLSSLTYLNVARNNEMSFTAEVQAWLDRLKEESTLHI